MNATPTPHDEAHAEEVRRAGARDATDRVMRSLGHAEAILARAADDIEAAIVAATDDDEQPCRVDVLAEELAEIQRRRRQLAAAYDAWFSAA